MEEGTEQLWAALSSAIHSTELPTVPGSAGFPAPGCLGVINLICQ